MYKTIINDKNKSRHSKALEEKLQVEVEMDEDACADMEEMCQYREKEIKAIAQNLHDVHEMYKEMAKLVDNQQSDIEIVTEKIHAAEKHVEKAEQVLLKVEKKRCVIL